MHSSGTTGCSERNFRRSTGRGDELGRKMEGKRKGRGRDIPYPGQAALVERVRRMKYLKPRPPANRRQSALSSNVSLNRISAKAEAAARYQTAGHGQLVPAYFPLHIIGLYE